MGVDVVEPPVVELDPLPSLVSVVEPPAAVPMARPPCSGPIQTWNMLYMSSAIPDSENIYPI